MPARLTAEQTAWVLNCGSHDIPPLIAARLLKPLGNPPANGIKFSPRRICWNRSKTATGSCASVRPSASIGKKKMPAEAPGGEWTDFANGGSLTSKHNPFRRAEAARQRFGQRERMTSPETMTLARGLGTAKSPKKAKSG